MQKVEVTEFVKNLTNNEEIMKAVAKSPELYRSLTADINKRITDERAEGLDGLDWRTLTAFSQELESQLRLSADVCLAFTDEKILMLLQDYFNLWFLEDEDSVPIWVTNPIRGMLMSLSKIGFNKSLEYLVRHTNLAAVDIDATMLLVALEQSNTDALGMIALFADKEGYGFNSRGALLVRIVPEIRRVFAEKERGFDQNLVYLLKQFKLFRD